MNWSIFPKEMHSHTERKGQGEPTPVILEHSVWMKDKKNPTWVLISR